MPDAVFSLRSPMPAPADEVYAWHARPGAFQRMQPPWAPKEGTYLPYEVSVAAWYLLSVAFVAWAVHVLASSILPDAIPGSRRWWYARIIPIDGRPHALSSVRSWAGDPRGRRGFLLPPPTQREPFFAPPSYH